MKQYLILADSISTYRDKQLTHGNVYPETEFLKDHIGSLETAKLIEEVAEHVVTAADLDNNPDFAANGIAEGDIIWLPVSGAVTEEELKASKPKRSRNAAPAEEAEQ